MKNLISNLLPVILLLNSISAFANNKGLLITNERFGMSKESFYNYEALSQENDERFNYSEDYSQDYNMLIKNLSFSSSVMSDYETVKSNYAFQIYGVKSLNYILQTGLNIGEVTLSSANPLSAPIIVLGGKIVKDSIDLMASITVDHLENKSVEALDLGLQMYRQTHSLSKIQSLTSMNEEEIYNELFGDNTVFDNSTYRDMNGKEKDVYHSFEYL